MYRFYQNYQVLYVTCLFLRVVMCLINNLLPWVLFSFQYLIPPPYVSGSGLEGTS
jgi:hypothetical protein